MGVTVSEKIELDVGLSVDSYYISLNENEVRIQRRQERQRVHTEEGGHREVWGAPTLRVEAGFTLWISKVARDAGNGNIGGKHITIELDAAPTGNIYDLLYSKLKEGLTNYVDA